MSMNLREFFERYGVSLGVLAVLALVIALVPGNSKQTGNQVGTSSNGPGSKAASATGPAAGSGAAGGTGGAGAAGAGGGGGGAGGAGGTGAGGSVAGADAGSGVAFGQGPNCRSDGRQVGISYYMPPCVQWTGTNNGGATADGVTANQIKIIRWLGFQDDATKAILQAY